MFRKGESIPAENGFRLRKLTDPKMLNFFGLIDITKCGDRKIEDFISSLINTGREMGK
jgi:hypothetical protein